MEFKVLSKTDSTTISVANIGNDCIVAKTTHGLGGNPLTDAITFVPRMNIDCECEPPKLKLTGITETAAQSYTFTDENIMVGEFTKVIMEQQKNMEVQEVQ